VRCPIAVTPGRFIGDLSRNNHVGVDVGGRQVQRQQRVRLRVPASIGQMSLLHLNVTTDGTCEMTEEEAESFLRAGWEKVAAGEPRGKNRRCRSGTALQGWARNP
jgi:hypothetical protein